MDEREQRDLIHFLARELKAYSRELMVYQLLVHRLKQSGSAEIDEMLNAGRHAPELQARFEKNFEGFDEMLPPPNPDISEKARELLEKWKPKDGLLN